MDHEYNWFNSWPLVINNNYVLNSRCSLDNQYANVIEVNTENIEQ